MRRSYRQYCAAARALDVVGDRWSLLVVRNLLLGPQTWSELRDGLPGVAKNLLSDRLEQLGRDGVVAHEGALYRLTERGAELEAVVFALADWGERHLMGPPHAQDALRLRYLITSLRRRLRPGCNAVTVQLYVGDAPFWVRLGADPVVVQGERDASAVLRCTVAGLRALLFEGTPLEGEAAEALRAAIRPRGS